MAQSMSADHPPTSPARSASSSISGPVIQAPLSPTIRIRSGGREAAPAPDDAAAGGGGVADPSITPWPALLRGAAPRGAVGGPRPGPRGSPRPGVDSTAAPITTTVAATATDP